MDYLETLIRRNAQFSEAGFQRGLKMLPSSKTLILGCVDPRVDPMDVLNLEPGEAAIIRNVGGRVNPALIDTLEILGAVSKVGGAELGAAWNLVVLQHTKCGIVGCHHHAPHLLTKFFDVSDDQQLAALEIDDPCKAVQVDIAALKANLDVPGGLVVSGLVYDVDTGLVETVVPAAPLRPGQD